MSKKNPIEWSQNDYEAFVLACDLKHNPEPPEFFYSEREKRPEIKKPRKKLPQGDPYFPFKNTNFRENVDQLMAELIKAKQKLAGDSPKHSKNVLPKVNVNFVQKNINKSGESPKRVRLKREEDKLVTAPQINDCEKMKMLYGMALSKLKHKGK